MIVTVEDKILVNCLVKEKLNMGQKSFLIETGLSSLK